MLDLIYWYFIDLEAVNRTRGYLFEDRFNFKTMLNFLLYQILLYHF